MWHWWRQSTDELISKYSTRWPRSKLFCKYAYDTAQAVLSIYKYNVCDFPWFSMSKLGESVQKFVGKQAAIVPGSPLMKNLVCVSLWRPASKRTQTTKDFIPVKWPGWWRQKLDKRKYTDVRYFSTLIDLSYFIMFWNFWLILAPLRVCTLIFFSILRRWGVHRCA